MTRRLYYCPFVNSLLPSLSPMIPSMGKRGNPNWGKPLPVGPVVPAVSAFEESVKELKLQPDQYVHSRRLREWACRNKNLKFIPESLLQAWGFETE
jgi:hypothetical protein